jgi:exodeoxyribonuclease V alpha subunit
MRDIQVLTPMHRTPAGVSHLNFVLQRALNPQGRVFLKKGDRVFRVGDKVMQTRNDYEKDVFNGDIGFISSAVPEETTCIILFDRRPVRYAFDELDDVALAYAITIHKSQGSEYPVVLIPMTLQHRIMLQRNLLYTGMTRAKKLLLFVGDRRALRTAVATTHPTRRRTTLAERLRRRLR